MPIIPTMGSWFAAALQAVSIIKMQAARRLTRANILRAAITLKR